MSLTMTRSLDEVEGWLGRDWRSCGGVFGTPRWWRAVELVRSHRLDVVYFMVSKRSNQRLCFPVYYHDCPSDAKQFAPSVPQTSERWAVIGGCSGSRPGFAVSGDWTPAEALSHGVSVAISEIQRNGTHGLSLTLFPAELVVGVANELGLQSSQLVLREFAAQTHLRQVSFEEYSSDLPGAARATIRRDRRRFHMSGMTSHVRSLRTVVDELAELWDQVEQRHGKPPKLSMRREMLSAEAEIINDNSMVVVCTNRSTGAIGAIALFYKQGADLTARLVGINYDLSAPTGAYFEALYYVPIEIVGTAGGSIWFGTGALHPKLARGATLVPLVEVSIRGNGDPAVSAADARELSHQSYLQMRSQRKGLSSRVSPTLPFEHFWPIASVLSSDFEL